jgi:exodeoxyribonuclease-5
MQLNEKQQLAVNRAADWYATQNTQVFKMAGYAGTGKTTVATTIARTLESDENTLYCAFTGKAACVMRQKGMPGQTIHSAIYDYETEIDPHTGRKHIVKHLKESLPYKLIVVDEASMVGTEVAHDLLSFQIPVLAIGDPGQLPPVGDNYSDLLMDPDIVLDEIMRQSDGNRIPAFAQRLRNGWAPAPGDIDPGPDLVVLQKNQFLRHFETLLTHAGQLICATNRNRDAFNKRARQLYGLDGMPLTNGEKVVRKKNDWNECTPSSLGVLSLVNGMTGTSQRVKLRGSAPALFDFVPECAPDATFKGLAYKKFEYAYTITCHAAQGSEWPYVVVYDDSWADPQNPKFRAAWRYTAATRAKSKLVWVTNR